MAGSPQFKIYSEQHGYIGSTKFAEDAACLVAMQGNGATIRWQHKHIVWREGSEQISAAESYDVVAATVNKRIQKLHEDGMARIEEFRAVQAAKGA